MTVKTNTLSKDQKVKVRRKKRNTIESWYVNLTSSFVEHVPLAFEVNQFCFLLVNSSSLSETNHTPLLSFLVQIEFQDTVATVTINGSHLSACLLRLAFYLIASSLKKLIMPKSALKEFDCNLIAISFTCASNQINRSILVNQFRNHLYHLGLISLLIYFLVSWC